MIYSIFYKSIVWNYIFFPIRSTIDYEVDNPEIHLERGLIPGV